MALPTLYGQKGIWVPATTWPSGQAVLVNRPLQKLLFLSSHSFVMVCFLQVGRSLASLVSQCLCPCLLSWP